MWLNSIKAWLVIQSRTSKNSYILIIQLNKSMTEKDTFMHWVISHATDILLLKNYIDVSLWIRNK